MIELLRDTRRYADYLRLLGERWGSLQATMPWTETREQAQDDYELAWQDFACWQAELESRLLACVVDRMDRIACRAVYGKGA